MTSNSDLSPIPETERAYDLGCCDGVVRLRDDSIILSDEGLGQTEWTHQYLGSCPYCDENYPWMRRLATSDTGGDE